MDAAPSKTRLLRALMDAEALSRDAGVNLERRLRMRLLPNPVSSSSSCFGYGNGLPR